MILAKAPLIGTKAGLVPIPALKDVQVMAVGFKLAYQLINHHLYLLEQRSIPISFVLLSDFVYLL